MARARNPMEQSFYDACLLKEIRFDGEEQLGRFRVDFFDRSRKLVIELDGHDSHKTKEQRTYDAKRDRYLHRNGFTVLRFTGSEIFLSLSTCIEEVEQALALMEPQSLPNGAVYIDWQFFDRSAMELLRYYRDLYPEKTMEAVTLSRFLDFVATYMKLVGRYNVHLFGTASSFSASGVDIDALKLRKSHRALFNISEHQNAFIAVSLVEHLHREGTQYRNIIFVGDDAAYPPLLDRGREIQALFRRDNQDTSMGSVQSLRWQDIQYVLGYCLGLATHEL